MGNILGCTDAEEGKEAHRDNNGDNNKPKPETPDSPASSSQEKDIENSAKTDAPEAAQVAGVGQTSPPDSKAVAAISEKVEASSSIPEISTENDNTTAALDADNKASALYNRLPLACATRRKGEGKREDAWGDKGGSSHVGSHVAGAHHVWARLLCSFAHVLCVENRV